MDSGSSRKLATADLLLLIAATAVGLALLRQTYGEMASHTAGLFAFYQGRGLGWRAVALISIEWAEWLLLPLLSCGTVAFVASSLRRPRPPVFRLARRAGFAAGFAAVVGLAVFSIMNAPRFRTAADLARFVRSLEIFAGPMVAGAWLIMMLGRQWRTEPTLLDRVGRSLGALWILALLFIWSTMWLQ